MKKLFIMFVVLIALFVSASIANAGPGNNNVPDSLAIYLNLDRQQIANANFILAEFYEFADNRFDRYSQLGQQIWATRIDTAKDPGLIGILIGNMTAEQVRIEREVNQRATLAQRALVGLLNPVQVTLLSRLVDALNLSQTAWAAVSANFLTQPLQPQAPVPSIGKGVADPTFNALLEAYKQRTANAATSTQ